MPRTHCASACRSLYNTIIIARILLTWFPNPPQAIASPLRYSSLWLQARLCYSDLSDGVRHNIHPIACGKKEDEHVPSSVACIAILTLSSMLGCPSMPAEAGCCPVQHPVRSVPKSLQRNHTAHWWHLGPVTNPGLHCAGCEPLLPLCCPGFLHDLIVPHVLRSSISLLTWEG